jgi:Cysteine-rich TM module stress tolerance
VPHSSSIILHKVCISAFSSKARSEIRHVRGATRLLPTAAPAIISTALRSAIPTTTSSSNSLCVSSPSGNPMRVHTLFTFLNSASQQPPQKDSGGGTCMACLAGICLCCCAEGMKNTIRPYCPDTNVFHRRTMRMSTLSLQLDLTPGDSIGYYVFFAICHFACNNHSLFDVRYG